MWFEVARVAYLAQFREGYRSIQADGVEVLVTDMAVRVVAPARFDDVLTVGVRCTGLKGARFRFEYAVERDGTLIMRDDERMKLKPGEKVEDRLVRFRTLGCYPLTGAIESDADSLEDIVTEMFTARTSERQGRLIDSDEKASMEKKKKEGYF